MLHPYIAAACWQVKQNFERFISCKTTIDDIYTKLRRIESTSTGISTEVLYQAIQEVWYAAATADSAQGCELVSSIS